MPLPKQSAEGPTDQTGAAYSTATGQSIARSADQDKNIDEYGSDLLSGCWGDSDGDDPEIAPELNLDDFYADTSAAATSEAPPEGSLYFNASTHTYRVFKKPPTGRGSEQWTPHIAEIAQGTSNTGQSARMSEFGLGKEGREDLQRFLEEFNDTPEPKSKPEDKDEDMTGM